MLAARCEQLHLLPPHTLAAMLGRLRVREGCKGPGRQAAMPARRRLRLRCCRRCRPLMATLRLPPMV